jgi:putative transposase
MGVQSGAHTRYELKYHFVWCPKYRRVVLKGNIARYLAKIIYGVAERYDLNIVELAVMPDHVHMFVSASPELAPASIIQTVKSITARKLFERFPGIKNFLWGGALWARGYFVMSSGSGTVGQIARLPGITLAKPSFLNLRASEDIWIS